jgi:glycosyltransferase involved in cell wall biosynthesis
MKILIVASYNKGRFAPFIVEQAEVLIKMGCEVDYFGLRGKGLFGYLKNLPSLKRRIKEFRPNVIHAHYGLSGLLANLQRCVPVVTTYHGSDINKKNVLPFSKMTMHFSAWNIFVSQKTLTIAKPKKRFSLLPCGIDISESQLTEKTVARQRMGMSLTKKYILFAGAFDNKVKNAPLAIEATSLIHEDNVELLELKGYTRDEVTLLMCAADVFLMTSFSEGSPQVIKEALACGCPIVSVDVGDVMERVAGVEGCVVVASDSQSIADAIRCAFTFEGKTKGRDAILRDGLTNFQVASEILRVYNSII